MHSVNREISRQSVYNRQNKQELSAKGDYEGRKSAVKGLKDALKGNIYACKDEA